MGTWTLGKLPNRVMGTGAITFWDDGRQVEDNLNCIYQFPGGEQITYASPATELVTSIFYVLTLTVALYAAWTVLRIAVWGIMKLFKPKKQ